MNIMLRTIHKFISLLIVVDVNNSHAIYSVCTIDYCVQRILPILVTRIRDQSIDIVRHTHAKTKFSWKFSQS